MGNTLSLVHLHPLTPIIVVFSNKEEFRLPNSNKIVKRQGMQIICLDKDMDKDSQHSTALTYNLRLGQGERVKKSSSSGVGVYMYE